MSYIGQIYAIALVDRVSPAYAAMKETTAAGESQRKRVPEDSAGQPWQGSKEEGSTSTSHAA